MGNIFLIKLITGEEIVGEIVRDDMDEIDIEDPMQMIPLDRGQMGLLRYAPMFGKVQTIRKSHVLIQTEPKEEQQLLVEKRTELLTGITVEHNDILISE